MAITRKPPHGWCTPVVTSSTRAVDGDTVEMLIQRVIKIRINELWCSETKRTKNPLIRAHGYIAQEKLSEILGRGEHSVFIGTDGDTELEDLITMSRFVGDVFVADDNVVTEMYATKLGFRTKTELEDFQQTREFVEQVMFKLSLDQCEDMIKKYAKYLDENPDECGLSRSKWVGEIAVTRNLQNVKYL